MISLDAIRQTPVLTASRDTTIVAAARMMREAHVGALVVVESAAARVQGAAKRPAKRSTKRPAVESTVGSTAGSAQESAALLPPEAQKLIGIVTDRDIVMAIVALDLDPNVFLLGDLLSRPLVTADAGLGMRDGLAIMNAKGIRRLPLVNAAGELTGMVTLDDLIIEAARSMQQVAGVIEREITSELALRPSRIRARKASAAKAHVIQAPAAAPRVAQMHAAKHRPPGKTGETLRAKTGAHTKPPAATTVQHLPFI